MSSGELGAKDPSAHRQPPRRPGRPARTSKAALVETVIALGLDSFTLTEVAARQGVGESTVYNYVSGRDELYRVAAASVFEQLDIDVDASTWTGYVDAIAERCFALAKSHPGLREYLLYGPYEASTLTIFEALIDRVQAWLPDIGEHLAYVLASRPVVTTLAYLDDPVLEPAAPWLRRALLDGLDRALAGGDLPPAPSASWRTKLRR